MNLPKDTDTKSFCSTLTLSKNEEIILQNKKETELFIINYIPDLNKNDLVDKKNKEKNELVKNYIQKKIKIIENNNDIFSNKKLLENMQKIKKSEKILFFYQKSFIIAINFINKILNKINSTLDAIPSSLKKISKIIYDLLCKKFKNTDTIELYKQISYFFFMKLFKYIFLSPDYYPLINNVILSEKTKKNLFKLFEILSQLISGDFYKSNENSTSDYTPFNWYFLENIHIIYNLCKNLISHKKKSNTYNNNDYFYSYSICFNKDILETLLNIKDNNRNIIFINNNHIKFKEIIDNLIKNKEMNNQNQKIVDYFLYFEIIYSGKYIDIMNIDLKNKNFKIKEEEININLPQPKKAFHLIKNKTNEKTELNNLASILN